MYRLPCAVCKEEHPRAEYRKRGGGVHKLCPKCRKKEYAERSATKKQMAEAKQKIEQQEMEERIRRRSKELRVEYNRITRTNRTRIRILKANEKPTKATIRNLAHREKQQALWSLALEEMLTKVREGQKISLGLSEYYAENICTDK